ncbi:aminoglycoside phosphotransferase (APT) family kinase protein [Kribbella antiqua]|uniref:Aminoglycoside phosphotransferase (APT) family kinase protein n=1 Tax=Kribbella antiqua TaxID=2512217 RepID=A0A4R2IN41_9ACTN|nr:aminoglycoside phosphotransferase family protein [Kribbella antiqua]TCO45992.1 aminoglycoside phosphotransferase (APT) family kinase protein [Kribbella antiqua]
MTELIAKLYPGSEIVQRTGGQLSTVYEVRRTDADPLIVKQYAPEWRWKQAKEVHVYGLLSGQDVPQVVQVGDGYTVLTKLDGVPLSEAEPPDWRASYEQIGRLLRRIHCIGQPSYGYLTDEILDPLPDNDQYMRRQFTKKLTEFQGLKGDPALHRRIREYVETHAELFKANLAPALCHNDFHEGNVLVDPETWRVTGFIDVENAIAADPLLDLAKTMSYSIRGDATKLQGVVDGYGDLPEDWRERTTLYRLYHSLELWDWFASIGNADPLDSIADDMAEIVS